MITRRSLFSAIAGLFAGGHASSDWDRMFPTVEVSRGYCYDLTRDLDRLVPIVQVVTHIGSSKDFKPTHQMTAFKVSSRTASI